MNSNRITREMRATYDEYFRSSGYRHRYPRPNEATLDFVLANGGRDARQILDFGCGNGRYSYPLLAQSTAQLTAYDISEMSLLEFEDTLRPTPYLERTRFVHNDTRALQQSAPYDLVLMLFGVLSHLGDRATRIDTLATLRDLMQADGRLILSVPSRLRRRPWELLKCALARRRGSARAPLNEAGNIYFTRFARGCRLTFFYHLYTVDDLRADLAAAGFEVRLCEAESVFPEWWITQSTMLSRIDRLLASWILPVFGYGIRVLAVPA